MADGSFAVFTGFPSESARNLCRLLMPCAESLHRKWDEDDAFPTTSLKELVVLTVAGDVENIGRFSGDAIDGCLLEKADDRDVKRSVLPDAPSKKKHLKTAGDKTQGAAMFTARRF